MRAKSDVKLESNPSLRRRIAEGLCAWLAFEFRCDRGYLFSEHYLAHPLGQLLRSNGSRVRAEFHHPTITREGLAGRPYSLDFVVEKDAKVTLGVETKWVGIGGVSPADLIWDAFRLEAFCRNKEATGLLILAGSTAKVRALINNPGFQKGSGGPLLPRPRWTQEDRHPHTEPFILSRDELPSVVEKYLSEKDIKHPGLIAGQVFCSAPKYHKSVAPISHSFAVCVWEIRCAPHARRRSRRALERGGKTVGDWAGESTAGAASGSDSSELSILKCLKDNGGAMGVRELSTCIGLNKRVISAILLQLVQRGSVIKTGKTRGTKYEIKSTLRHHTSPRTAGE